MSELLKLLTRQTFDPLVNQPFHITFDTGALALDLVECKSLGNGQQEEGEREPFSLIFQGPPEPILAQQIYPVTHSSVGDVEIFLVPLGPAKGGMKYEAVFT